MADHRSDHSLPQYTKATESWWVGKSRDELDARAQQELNRMRWGKGNVYINAANFDGPATFDGVAKIRKAGWR